MNWYPINGAPINSGPLSSGPSPPPTGSRVVGSSYATNDSFSIAGSLPQVPSSLMGLIPNWLTGANTGYSGFVIAISGNQILIDVVVSPAMSFAAQDGDTLNFKI
jgi:hypothetical protein